MLSTLLRYLQARLRKLISWPTRLQSLVCNKSAHPRPSLRYFCVQTQGWLIQYSLIYQLSVFWLAWCYWALLCTKNDLVTHTILSLQAEQAVFWVRRKPCSKLPLPQKVLRFELYNTMLQCHWTHFSMASPSFPLKVLWDCRDRFIHDLQDNFHWPRCCFCLSCASNALSRLRSSSFKCSLRMQSQRR